MEPLSNLLFLLEPASIALVLTALFVVTFSAHRALSHDKEHERVGGHRDGQESSHSITLDSSQALMIPVVSSVSLLLMFYLFSSVSQLVTAFTAVASASSLAFCVGPYVTQLNSHLGVIDPIVSRCCGGCLTRIQLVLSLISTGVVLSWLVSGHWLLNNMLGISICVAFVSHVKLPNVRTCALLLSCLFAYDIFWVFFSERFFGANVMVSVATQQATNPMHTVARTLHLPVPTGITTKLDLPVKLLFPRNMWKGATGAASGASMDFMMLGLGDMAIPGMLLALVLSFDNRKQRSRSDGYGAAGSEGLSLGPHRPPGGGYSYMFHASVGYGVGLVAALAAGVLTRSAQPALLYLVPSTLGPVTFFAWQRNELHELWTGSPLAEKEKEKMYMGGPQML